MEAMNWFEIVGQAVKAKRKFGVFVSNQLDPDKEKDLEIWSVIIENISKLYGFGTAEHNKVLSYLIGNESLMLFDTQEEQLKFFEIFNSDPVYSSAVYACTFSPEGEMMNENT